MTRVVLSEKGTAPLSVSAILYSFSELHAFHL